MSGTYGFNPKVLNPNVNFIQSRSDGGMPFYFGASQVPLVLATEHHNHTYQDTQHNYVKGKGIKGYVSKSSNIVLPSHIKSLG